MARYDAENRIEVVVDNKSIRDALCHRLKQSPLRKSAAPRLDVKACLTIH